MCCTKIGRSKTIARNFSDPKKQLKFCGKVAKKILQHRKIKLRCMVGFMQDHFA